MALPPISRVSTTLGGLTVTRRPRPHSYPPGPESPAARRAFVQLSHVLSWRCRLFSARAAYTTPAMPTKHKVQTPKADTMSIESSLPVIAHRYFGFIDAADGAKAGGDSMCLAIAHREDRTIILDLIRETKPPFSPDKSCGRFCAAAEDVSNFRRPGRSARPRGA